MVDSCVSVFFLLVVFKNVEDRNLWAFLGVYGPNDDVSRRLLWKELARVYSWWNLPWCVARDFNVTCFPGERLGVGVSVGAMKDFSDFISDLGLMDYPMVGGHVTWSNNWSIQSWSRINWFLCSFNWDSPYSYAIQRRFPRLYSDHFPIRSVGVLGVEKNPFNLKIFG